MAHGLTCAKSLAPPSRCNCDCEGRNHGSAAVSLSVVSASTVLDGAPEGTPLQERAEAEIRAGDFGANCSAYFGTQLCTWLIATVDWSADDFSVARDVATSVLDAMNETLADAILAPELRDQGELRSRLRRAYFRDHFICTICLVVLIVHDVGKATVKEGISHAADGLVRLLDLPNEIQVALARALLTRSMQAGADVVLALLVDPAKVKVVRLAGYLMCPDWTAHPDGALYRHCVKPLLTEAALDDEFRYLELKFGEKPE